MSGVSPTVTIALQSSGTCRKFFVVGIYSTPLIRLITPRMASIALMSRTYWA
jgi:hypothetical protein